MIQYTAKCCSVQHQAASSTAMTQSQDVGRGGILSIGCLQRVELGQLWIVDSYMDAMLRYLKDGQQIDLDAHSKANHQRAVQESAFFLFVDFVRLTGAFPFHAW
jgi:hypothetical protein